MIGRPYVPKQVFIDPAVKGRAEVSALLGRLPAGVSHREGLPPAMPFDEAKATLFLTQQKGGFVQKCPGIHKTVCCNYYVINLVSNCGYDCSYCFLQGYITNNPWYQVYVNEDRLIEELDSVVASRRFARIGTGELSDSLLLDHLTHHGSLLMDYFQDKPWVTIELKTKSINIDLLLSRRAQKNVVVSWSLNTERIWRGEECGTPSMVERLEAARTVAEHGYAIGIHFDPIIYYDGWEKEYLALVDLLFQRVRSERVAWVSLGTLRFFPELKARIYERWPQTPIFAREFIRTDDGKIRYFFELRKEIYATMRARVKAVDPAIPVYLCMEVPQMWGDLRGEDELRDALFDQAFRKRLSEINV